MTIKREELPDVTNIDYITETKYETIFLEDNQVFMRTEKCWELWQKEPLQFLKRWRRKFVFWIGLKGDSNG